MQENNFEKRVQQKLDELQLTPSEPVWQNIEAVIRKKKERRLVFWFLPFLLVAGGWVWWQTKNVPQQTVAKTQPQQTFSKPHIDQNTQTTNQKVQEVNTKKPARNQTATAAQEHAQPQANNVVITSMKLIGIGKQIGKQKHIQHQVAEARKTKAQKAAKNSNVNKHNDVVAAEVKNRNNAFAAETHTPTQNNTAGINKNQIVKLDSLQQQKAFKADSAAKPIPQLNKNAETKKHLQWSVVSRIGVSKPVDALLNGFGPKAMQTSYPAADYTSGGTYNGGNPDSGYKQPATPTSGTQFSIGALLKKSAGKKSFATVGLQYSFYSYYIEVGTELPADSAMGLNRVAGQKAFRNNGKQNQFKNTLHFIELPIGFEYQLLKKYPLHVQHGITLSQLVSAKVLQYDYASSIYFQQSDDLRKTGISFFTTVDYTFWKGKTTALQAGPHLQYGLQPMFKNSAQSHLLSGGLAINMTF